MKPWKVVALLTLPMLLFAAWRIWSIYKERHEPVVVKQGPPERKISQDDLVNPRKMYIATCVGWLLRADKSILSCSDDSCVHDLNDDGLRVRHDRRV